MPRDGSGIYTRPPGTNGVPDTTIESSKYNGFVSDVETDLNTPRPIVAGGTGASSAAAARAALGVTSGAAQVTNYDSHVFETGSFWSLSTATAAPVASNMSGHAILVNNDPNYISLDAVDNATGLLWTRHKTGGVWSAWALHNASDKLPLAGGTLTGGLTVNGDVTTIRSAGVTGAYFFGSGAAGAKYLYWDGSVFSLAGGALNVSSVNGSLNGNATTATNASNAYACSGNAATANFATTSGSCSGNAASSSSCSGNAASSSSCSGNAASSSSCSGNAATATYATTAGSISGGSITIGDGGALEGPWYIDMKAPGHAGHDFCTRLMVNSDHTLDITTPSCRTDTEFSAPTVWTGLGYRCNTGGNHGSYVFALNWPGGTFYINTVAAGTIYFSDYRTKRDIRPLPGMWERVKALRPISYKHRDYTPAFLAETAKNEGKPFVEGDDKERWGFAAHELQEDLVETAATGRKDEERVLQSPNPMTVIAALTKALQEAMGRIEALEAAR